MDLWRRRTNKNIVLIMIVLKMKKTWDKQTTQVSKINKTEEIDSIQTEGRDSIKTEGRDSYQTDGNDSYQMDGIDSIQIEVRIHTKMEGIVNTKTKMQINTNSSEIFDEEQNTNVMNEFWRRILQYIIQALLINQHQRNK